MSSNGFEKTAIWYYQNKELFIGYLLFAEIIFFSLPGDII
jgi:hypothetical protein